MEEEYKDFDKVVDANMDDSCKLYLREIQRYPLLDSETEIALAKRIEKGDVEAKNIFINANLRLVVYIAMKYRKASVQVMDLIQEGNMALMNAVDKFDYTKGYRFSTYAVKWIKSAVVKNYQEQNSGVIKIPHHTQVVLYKYKRMCENFVMTHGYEPSDEEAASNLNISIEGIQKLKEYEKYMSPISGEQTQDAEGTATIWDIVSDKDQMITTEDKLYIQNLKMCMDNANLDAVEKFVISSKISNTSDADLKIGVENTYAIVMQLISDMENVEENTLYQKVIKKENHLEFTAKKDTINLIFEKAVRKIGPQNLKNSLGGINNWLDKLEISGSREKANPKDLQSRYKMMKEALEKKAGLEATNAKLKMAGYREVYPRNFDELGLYCCLKLNDMLTETKQEALSLKEYEQFIKLECDLHYIQIANAIIDKRDDADYVFPAANKETLADYRACLKLYLDDNSKAKKDGEMQYVTETITDAMKYHISESANKLLKIEHYSSREELYKSVISMINTAADKFVKDLTFRAEKTRYYVVKWFIKYIDFCMERKDKFSLRGAYKDIFLDAYEIKEIEPSSGSLEEIIEGKSDIKRNTFIMFLLGIDKLIGEEEIDMSLMNEILSKSGYSNLDSENAWDQYFIAILNGEESGFSEYGKAVYDKVTSMRKDKGTAKNRYKNAMKDFLFGADGKTKSVKIDMDVIKKAYINKMYVKLKAIPENNLEKLLETDKWDAVRVYFMLNNELRKEYYRIEPEVIREIINENYASNSSVASSPVFTYTIRNIVHSIGAYKDYLKL